MQASVALISEAAARLRRGAPAPHSGLYYVDRMPAAAPAPGGPAPAQER